MPPLPWWVWLIIGLVLAAGLDLVIHWVWIRLRPPPEYGPTIHCPFCGAAIPEQTWRCYKCRRWVRRRGLASVLTIVQYPAYLGGVILLVVLLLLSALSWLVLLLLGPILRARVWRRLIHGFAALWMTLLSPVRRWWGRRERRAYWWRGGQRILPFFIPQVSQSPGSTIAWLLETTIGGREVPGAWRGAVVWLREPDRIVDDAFLAQTHLSEVAASADWVDRGTVHKVDLEPTRDWVGWRGTRQDLEALGDHYLARSGGIGLVALGTGDDRLPVEWVPGESPTVWVSMEKSRSLPGWNAFLHWNLPYDPHPVPPEQGIRSL
jgi:predicted nucleic acid-binding Zn ribbon protein